jgi:hypothetical protein
MEVEHPIPQQISAYQFRLVGDMTLKQFFQVAAGALVSLVLYASGMPGYVKWPLIIISFLGGVAFAFFPLQDRPLATWIGLFIKAIYSPTLFFWKKGSETRQFFQLETAPQATTPAHATPTVPVPAKPATQKEEVALEKKEQEFLTKVEAHMTPSVAPSLMPQPQQQSATSTIKVTPRDKVQVPHVNPSKVDRKEHVKEVAETKTENEGLNISPSVTPSATKPLSDAKAAQFSPEAAPPAPPTRANIIVGQVIDADKNIIDSAILEIKDSDGRPVRALKSNKLGHFMIVTPLVNGNYEITTEKEGYTIEPLKLEVKGEIIPPIAIIAKKEEAVSGEGGKDIYQKSN